MPGRLPLTACALFALVAAPAAASQQRAEVRQTRLVKRESPMVVVPAGSFIYGADDAELAYFRALCLEELGEDYRQVCDDQDRWKDFGTGAGKREVYLDAFEIDRFEVTTAEYRVCVAQGFCEMRPLVAGDTRFVVDEWPVVNVTWNDADSYCRWRGKRLPSEAEWEKAARGSDGRRWPWGAHDRDDGCNRGRMEPEFQRTPPRINRPGGLGTLPDESDGFAELAVPGSLPFGRSPYGLHDMCGNASEWVADWYDAAGYQRHSMVDPRGPASGHQKVTRGGSFFEPRFFSLPYYRNAELPTERSITRGFRCARSLADEGEPAGARADRDP